MSAREHWSAGQHSHAVLTERLDTMFLHVPNITCCITILWIFLSIK